MLLRRIWAVAIIVLALIQAGQAAGLDFFAPSPDKTYRLDPSDIFPNGQKFPLTLYSLQPRDMDALGLRKDSAEISRSNILASAIEGNRFYRLQTP